MFLMFNFELFVDLTLLVVNQQISLSTTGDGCVDRWKGVRYILVDTMHVCIAGVSGLISYASLSYSDIQKIPPHRSRWYRFVVGLLWAFAGCTRALR